MVFTQGKSKLAIALMLAAPLTFSSVLYAAKPIDLNQQKISILQSFISGPTAAANQIQFHEINRQADFKQTLHIRVQETYQNHPVWGADAVLHIPQGDNSKAALTSFVSGNAGKVDSMDGVVYQDITADLANTPNVVFTNQQAQKAIDQAVSNYQHKVGGKVAVQEQQSELIVFVDKSNKAHWAYHVSFYADPIKAGDLPSKPNYIVDAISFTPYEQWDDIQTRGVKKGANADGGGYGGNVKMGKMTYDGLPNNLDKLRISKEANVCSLENKDVTVKGYRTHAVVKFSCTASNHDHNNVFWDGELEATNSGYSPPNDALFGGAVIKDMYQKWYNVPVLTKNGQPMMLYMIVHAPIDNAYWDGKQMTFGDGVNIFYPLTSIGVASHEISHGFTQQHSNLRYYAQSGGMNESFSDMAAQAAELYAFGKNSWQIGPEIFKAKDKALRYMDMPSKDCNGKKPGNWCSIDSADQYKSGLDVHFSSGVYNRLFYLMGTSKGWDAKKAFDVMVHANSNYWTSNATFDRAACGVLKATKDLGYNADDVKKALDVVKVKYDKC